MIPYDEQADAVARSHRLAQDAAVRILAIGGDTTDIDEHIAALEAAVGTLRGLILSAKEKSP